MGESSPHVDGDMLDDGPVVFESHTEAYDAIKADTNRYGTFTIKLDPSMINAIREGKSIAFDMAHGEYALIVEGT